MVTFVLVLAAIWGVGWALFLEYVPLGRWLAARRTWLTVVIGVGVDLGLVALVLPFEYWWPVAAVVAVSSVGVIARSIVIEMREWAELMEQEYGEKTGGGE